jgi:hypothetical protein
MASLGTLAAGLRSALKATAICTRLRLRAARDEGAIKAGGDSPIDVWLEGEISKVVAVRFWIGLKDAAASIKAKAEIEGPAQKNHWHTHVEVPNPIPPDSTLWVEIETEGGTKQVGSFDLKAGVTP